MDEIRKAGDYTIIKTMQIGEKELVIGENMNDADGNYYMTANYESNELFERLEYKKLPRPFYPLDKDATIEVKEIL